MEKYILKSALVAEIEKRIKECDKLADAAADNNLSNTQQANELLIRQYTSLLHFIDTLEVKEVDLEKTKWSPSKKQIESLGALVRYNIGVFDYQKLNEVAILYDDLTKILDYETDRQK